MITSINPQLTISTVTPMPTVAPDEGLTPIIATIPVGVGPIVVGVNISTDWVYVANHTDGTASVIDGATNAVITTFPVGGARSNVWVGVNPSTDRVYVSKAKDNTVYVIAETP